MLHPRTNKRRTVEIYFVLYLSALVLLISKTGNKENKVDDIQHKSFDLPFILKPEKNVLMCNIWLDSLGNKRYEVDSLNYIWDIGEVENVRYEFVIEDQELNHSVRLTNNAEYNYNTFKFKEEAGNRRAIFYWEPDLEGNMDKSYTVYVSATAQPLDEKNIQRVKANTQFTLIITHISDTANKNLYLAEQNNDLPLDRQREGQIIEPQINVNIGKMSLLQERSEVKYLAFKEWKNKIFCFGFNPKYDLAKPPDIKIINNPKNNGGSVYIDSYLDNTIVLKGKTPAFGKSQVSLTLVRKYDLYETSISFDIIPQDLETPNYPSEMYPEQKYRFDPKLPLSVLEDAVTLLKLGDKIVAADYQGGSIEFTPTEYDVGKTFNFERIVGGMTVGKSISIKVLPYPKPEITRMAGKSDNVVILNVTSYGWTNKKENRIKELVLTGNAKYRQLYGKTSEDREKSIWYEQFEITPLNDKEPFTFSVVAVDYCGNSSKKLTY